MQDSIVVTIKREFNNSAEQVFDAWLQPDLVRQWLGRSLTSMGLTGEMRRVEIEPRIGGKYIFSDMRDTGEAIHWGTYQEISRPHKLVFTWFTNAEDEAENNSSVTLTIQSTAQGCTATINHLMSAKYAEYIPQTEQGWGAMLEQSGL